MTRAKSIAFALRIGMGRSVVKDIRRYFNTAKRDRGMKWVYGHPTEFALLLPTGATKTFAQMAREAGA